MPAAERHDELVRGLHSVSTGHPAGQFHHPELNPDQEQTLLRRNYLLLQVGQASLGLIGRDVLGLAVEPRPGGIVLHLAVRQETREVAEDVDDICFELEAFLAGGPEQRSCVSTRIYVGPADKDWPGSAHALLFLAKLADG
ncbi:hypothetical protein AB0B31_05570 [Catellatospora citrea]|uniref:hypothetical protein n=1 Tax=Catellatospora citrea TaxID=53366 RepID=UPI0033DCA0B7